MVKGAIAGFNTKGNHRLKPGDEGEETFKAGRSSDELEAGEV